jgi:hypothetical protein
MSLTNTVQYYGTITEHINRTYPILIGQIFIDQQKIMTADHHDREPWKRYFEPWFGVTRQTSISAQDNVDLQNAFGIFKQ